MTQTIADVMTPNPVTLSADASVMEAALVMRDHDIGDVIVCDGQTVCGIVTDRDLVVRALADRVDPQHVALRDICSNPLTTIRPDTRVEDAITLMRENALRRLPVVDGLRPVGVVSLGDLAATRDPDSALADISSAAPNN
jgi:CBS domain-containing protein